MRIAILITLILLAFNRFINLTSNNSVETITDSIDDKIHAMEEKILKKHNKCDNYIDSYKINKKITLSEKQKINKLINTWISTVTSTQFKNLNQKVNAISNLFTNDGILWGTVSTTIRYNSNDSLKNYFKYFAALPKLNVLRKQFNIKKIYDNVWVNNAYIEWYWDEIGEPIAARMTFICRKTNNEYKIFELHSSVLPFPQMSGGIWKDTWKGFTD